MLEKYLNKEVILVIANYNRTREGFNMSGEIRGEIIFIDDDYINLKPIDCNMNQRNASIGYYKGEILINRQYIISIRPIE